MGNNSFRVYLKMTSQTASILISNVAARLCEDQGQWSSQPQSVTLGSEGLERGIAASLREAVAAGIGAVIPKTHPTANDDDYRHLALLCTSGRTARAALCMSIDEGTPSWIEDATISQFFDPSNDTAMVLASFVAKAVRGHCRSGGLLGSPTSGEPLSVLGDEWNLTGGSAVGWRVAFDEGTMSRIMAKSQKNMCERLWPWVQQYQDLLQARASSGKYLEALRGMVLEQQCERLKAIFECSKADDLVELGDKEVARRVAKLVTEVFHPKHPDGSWMAQHGAIAWGIIDCLVAGLGMVAWCGTGSCCGRACTKVGGVRQFVMQETVVIQCTDSGHSA